MKKLDIYDLYVMKNNSVAQTITKLLMNTSDGERERTWLNGKIEPYEICNKDAPMEVTPHKNLLIKARQN